MINEHVEKRDEQKTKIRDLHKLFSPLGVLQLTWKFYLRKIANSSFYKTSSFEFGTDNVIDLRVPLIQILDFFRQYFKK